MDFISNHLELIFVIVGVSVFVIQAARTLGKAKKIDREGIETDAVVTRVEELWDPDTASSTYMTYVRYRDENGEYRESPMEISTAVDYETGEQVRIRFIPGVYDLVRAAKKEE